MSSAPLIRMLLRAYPKAWRQEHGQELALALTRQSLSVPIAADVFAHGLWQRIRTTQSSWIVGAIYGVKIAIGSVMNSISPLSPALNNRLSECDLLFGFVLGYLTVARDRRYNASPYPYLMKFFLTGIVVGAGLSFAVSPWFPGQLSPKHIPYGTIATWIYRYFLMFMLAGYYLGVTAARRFTPLRASSEKDGSRTFRNPARGWWKQ